MKYKFRGHTSFNPVYSYNLTVLCGSTFEEADKYITANWGKLHKGSLPTHKKNISTVGACFFDANNQICSHYVWFKNSRPQSSIIAHESFHSVAHVLDFVGVEWSRDSEEAYAYLLDWTVETINKSLLKIRTKK